MSSSSPVPAAAPLPGSPAPGTTTVGVAIAVPEPWGAQLQEFRERLGDRTAGGIPTHVTLAPPHEVDEDCLDTLQQHLAAASTTQRPFRMHLRGTGTFRPVSPVVFVTVAEGISACEQLATAVRRGPLETERQFPYHPHVTVAHHLGDDVLDRAYRELAGFECDFVVEQFSLYVHERESGWMPTRDFPLTGPARRGPGAGPRPGAD